MKNTVWIYLALFAVLLWWLMRERSKNTDAADLEEHLKDTKVLSALGAIKTNVSIIATPPLYDRSFDAEHVDEADNPQTPLNKTENVNQSSIWGTPIFS